MTSDRPPDAEELLEFDRYRQQGLEILGASASDTPKYLVQAIDEFVTDWQDPRRGFRSLLKPRVDPTETARALAVVWGDQIVRHFEWQWICHVLPDEERYAVAAPNRALVIYAPHFINDCFEDPQKDCTAMLAFNMQEEGQFTGVQPNGYVDVMSGVFRVVPRR